MAIRLVPAGATGGGARIPPSRARRPRLITTRWLTAAGSLGAFGVAATDVATSGGRLVAVATGVVALGLAFAVVAVVVRRQAFIPWAVLATAGGYLAGREGHAVVDGRAAGVGVLLLLGAELATWSIEHDSRIRVERAVVLRQAATLACVAAAALLVDVALLSTASLPGGGGVLLASTGVAAAVAAVAFVIRLLRA